MSIYIYGVDLPQHGFINLTVFANGHVVGPDDGFNSFDTVAGRAIPAPEHGRLGDLDALMKQIEHDTPLSDVFEKTIRRYLKNAPTIIPADQKEEQT